MCNCENPGWCETHQITKDRILWEHCRRNEIVIVGNKKLEPPGLVRRAIMFAKTQFTHFLNGSPIVSDSVLKERIAICEVCPLFRSTDRMCLECGCYMDMKAKLADVSCPLEEPKWKSIIEEKRCKSC